ncbi:MAG: DsbA family protein [bacterium]|nr:DsbA family protein [bacterium]
MGQKNQNGLVFAVLFASTVIAGSLVFLGMQLSGGSSSNDDLKTQIAEGIDAYIADNAPGNTPPPPSKVEGDFTDDDPFMGADDAPVVVVEFSDYQCPFCGKFFNETLPQIKENYIDTGKVKLVYRDLPLSFHPDAYPAALLAECVRDQKGDEGYFTIHDVIFANISQSGLDYDLVKDEAVKIGVNLDELNGCIESDKFKAEIDADQADAGRAGISGTPGFIINGNIVSGAQPFSSFEAIIEAELAK